MNLYIKDLDYLERQHLKKSSRYKICACFLFHTVYFVVEKQVLNGGISYFKINQFKELRRFEKTQDDLDINYLYFCLNICM